VNIAHLLLRTATVHPDRPAILQGERVLFDYRTFAGRASSIAAALRDTMGCAPSDRVALFMTNCPEYLEVLYGIWWSAPIWPGFSTRPAPPATRKA
jgi:long-chain acyl-CoA synthetase